MEVPRAEAGRRKCDQISNAVTVRDIWTFASELQENCDRNWNRLPPRLLLETNEDGNHVTRRGSPDRPLKRARPRVRGGVASSSAAAVTRTTPRSAIRLNYLFKSELCVCVCMGGISKGGGGTEGGQVGGLKKNLWTLVSLVFHSAVSTKRCDQMKVSHAASPPPCPGVINHVLGLSSVSPGSSTVSRGRPPGLVEGFCW